jgi:diadenosine tetraphosphate (Ap4A) HIT family hydrolase
MTPCYSCERNWAERLPDRERVWDDDAEWRLALAFDSALPGWMCLVPRRHVLGLHELPEPAAAMMGRLLWAASAALVAVTGCAKTYVMLFAEKEGFEHLHLHLVPRPADLTVDRRGPGIFAFLGERQDAGGAAEDALAARCGQRSPHNSKTELPNHGPGGGTATLQGAALTRAGPLREARVLQADRSARTRKAEGIAPPRSQTSGNSSQRIRPRSRGNTRTRHGEDEASFGGGVRGRRATAQPSPSEYAMRTSARFD